jgi:transcriptional regulator with XRE-family HTH domain
MPLPSEVFRSRLREVRRLKGWTQQDLAEALARLGLNISAFAITRIETGNRGVSLDQAIAMAAVLGVSPLHMIVPLDDDGVQLAPQLSVTTADARAWLRGQRPLKEADERIFLFQTPPSEADWFPFTPGPWRSEDPKVYESTRAKWEREIFRLGMSAGRSQGESEALDIPPRPRKPRTHRQSTRSDAEKRDKGNDHE